MITRTAKGTASDKSSGLTLTLASVSLARRLLLVGIGYDAGAGAPVIKWGNHLMTPIVTVTGNGLTSRIVGYRRRQPSKTKSIVATWSGSAPTAKALWASTYSEVGSLDLDSGLSQAATAAPNSGTAQESNVAVELFIGCMASEGPSSDAAGTPGGSYSAGQRVGTTGAPPGSNITVQEIFKIVSAAESTQAALSGATNRDWSSVLATFSDDRRQDFNITQSDDEDLEEIFDTDDLDTKDGFITYNILLNRHEMYHIDPDDGTRTLKATWKPNTSAGWVAI